MYLSFLTYLSLSRACDAPPSVRLSFTAGTVLRPPSLRLGRLRIRPSHSIDETEPCVFGSKNHIRTPNLSMLLVSGASGSTATDARRHLRPHTTAHSRKGQVSCHEHSHNHSPPCTRKTRMMMTDDSSKVDAPASSRHARTRLPRSEYPLVRPLVRPHRSWSLAL